MFNLEEELKKLPDKPGVYLMHDAHDNIIYIGKAKVLKNRVRQYFQTRQRSPKIERMISLIDRFEYIVVDTEIEALVLENNLIKEHHPKYNTMLMDDKTYPYVKITLGEDYPRVLVVRKQLRDKAKYFGPYPSVTALRETLELLRSIYKFRNCKGRTAGDGSGRTCLYHHMGQCMGPCMKLVSKEEYRKSIDAVMQVLNGNFDAVKKQLTEQMMAASEELKFEEAAGFRDLLKGIQTLENRQKITNTDEGNRDVIAIAKAGDEAVAQVFFIREGRMIGREHFHLTGVEHSEKSEIMTDFVKQYYAGAPNVPRELLLGDDIEDEELIAGWLSEKSGRKVYIRLPRKGQKEKLVTLAEKNAAMVLIQDSERIKTDEARTIGAVRSLSELIGVPGLRRIESYDISNISGFESVGSMVVFEDGKSKKQDYRKFKIKTVVGPDDYASMREVLTRRFTHGLAEQEERGVGGKDAELFGFARFPDVILMDGGRGQVNIALSVLSELGISIAVCGMVKDDNHRTRGLYYNNEELPIDTGSELFKLITRIQDETHRFAIEYHRKLRTKKQVHSVLDDIEGIGEVRRRALMKRFVSIEAMREADYEDILALPEMNAASAQAVYDFFHRQ